MPKILAPPVHPIECDIALFARAYFNIELTKYQLEIIETASKGKKVYGRKKLGYTTAQKVLFAYVAEGLKPGGRVRLPQHQLPPREKFKGKGLTKEGRVLAMIKRPGGAYNFELSRIALKYTSVISELRKDGHNIIADRQYQKNGRASNTYRYRLAEE